MGQCRRRRGRGRLRFGELLVELEDELFGEAWEMNKAINKAWLLHISLVREGTPKEILWIIEELELPTEIRRLTATQ